LIKPRRGQGAAIHLRLARHAPGGHDLVCRCPRARHGVAHRRPRLVRASSTGFHSAFVPMLDLAASGRVPSSATGPG
jgi:hypothetical protein